MPQIKKNNEKMVNNLKKLVIEESEEEEIEESPKPYQMKPKRPCTAFTIFATEFNKKGMASGKFS